MEVVLVARGPEVFVGALEPEQAQRLVQITRSTRDRVRLRRAGIVLASVQGRSAAEIAVMFAASQGYVREVIHAFNEVGFAALDPKWSGGRPRKFGPVARELICQTARVAVWHVESGEAGGLPGRAPPPAGLHRDGAASAAGGRDQLAGHQDLEDQP